MNLPIDDLPALAGGTLFLIGVSWKSLRRPGSHGFYRFFAWEATLGLCVLNREPVGDQAISEALLLASLLLLALGFGALMRHGRAGRLRPDGALYDWERTTRLVTSGIYSWIRHPMYVSVLTLAWGMCFRGFSLPALALAVVTSYFLLRTADADERECLAFFGDAYRDYMQRTRRFLPFLY